MGRVSNIKPYTPTSRSVACAEAVIALRERFGLSQKSLGKALRCSPTVVSRMERGDNLSAELCIQLGNIAGDPECWFFWECAGLRSSDLLRIIPDFKGRTEKDEFCLRVVHAGPRVRVKESDLVAIPVLPLVAGTHGGKGAQTPDWNGIVPTAIFASPKGWSPNPTRTTCFRVRGRSMMPTIPDGCIVVVDGTQTRLADLQGMLVVAYHKRDGLIVSRLQNIDHVDVLVPEDKVGWANVNLHPGWKVLGKVLWWIARAA
jgi:transcriptional regulator with XRE-family HTH domain